MRTVRFAIAALIGMALAVLPISAGFATASAGRAEMIVNAADDGVCPCCGMTQHHGTGICNPKCCCVATLVEPQPLTGPRSRCDTDVSAAALSPFSTRPDLPPPRS